MMRSLRLAILISLASVLVSPALASEDTCADRFIVAGAVRTPQDAKTLVRCAYEFVQEVGFEEARRAFNEDERWKSGPTYIFVGEVTSLSDQARVFVFPPDPSREGAPFGLLIDAYGNDFFKELYRLMSSFDEAWIYYILYEPGDRQGRAESQLHQEHRLGWHPGRNRDGDLSK